MHWITIIIILLFLVFVWYMFIAPRFYESHFNFNMKMRDMHIKQIKKIIKEFNIGEEELYDR